MQDKVLLMYDKGMNWHDIIDIIKDSCEFEISHENIVHIEDSILVKL